MGRNLLGPGLRPLAHSLLESTHRPQNHPFETTPKCSMKAYLPSESRPKRRVGLQPNFLEIGSWPMVFIGRDLCQTIEGRDPALLGGPKLVVHSSPIYFSFKVSLKVAWKEYGSRCTADPKVLKPCSLDLTNQGSRRHAYPKGSQCPAKPKVLKLCSLDLRFQGLDALPIPRSRSLSP
ncbi:uncharacterized protein G2W53_017528 [Senna tora]|uniref:Uncharacterized protein n=1 Tax=Senna tora TaxID=362788 RepID=A0A834TYM6_9FABA|nr:uncharacterized protein G2W53_017528 [Senna tora]